MIRAHRMLWLSNLVLIAAALAVTALLWSRLPDPLPTHWDGAGHVNGWMPKSRGAFVAPAMMLILLAVFAALPAISPKGFRMERFGTVYSWTVLGMTAFLFAIHVFALEAALGHDAAIQRGVPMLLGLGTLLLGNWMPKIRRNFFVGIRTPWTLADEEVWTRTHRFAGKTMVLGGLAAILLALLPAPFWLPVAAVMAGALLPAIYSFFIWKGMQHAR